MVGRLDQFLDAAERELVARALSVVHEQAPKQGALLEGMHSRLRRTAELIEESPSIASSWEDGAGRPFSARSLMDQLCQVPDHDLDLNIPTKAVLGQAYLVAKINFLKALRYNVEAVGAAPEIGHSLQQEIAQSIYTKLAEELFVSIVTDPSAHQPVKMGAARFLFRIWEERLHIEVDDFAPLLESTWGARAKVLPVLGTMLGTHEVFRLFNEAQDKRFLDYFGEDDVEEEQLFAFEEFLFGLSYEEIVRIRNHLSDEGRSVISRDAAQALLGENAAAPPGANPAQELYSSYKKRRVNAEHRHLTGSPGPHKTAEEYVMIAFLQRGASPSSFGMKAVRP